jgi:hypothetical protein
MMQGQKEVKMKEGVYGMPLGELKGKTEINGGEGPGVVILKFVSTEGDDVYENYEMKMPHFISPHGKLVLTMTNKNGAYVGKQITFSNNWDFEACATQAAAGDGQINFKWRTKYDNAVEITTTYFGKYNTRYSSVVLLPSIAKMKGLMRETIDDEMVDPVLFDVRDGGSDNQVGYMGRQREKSFLKETIEIAVYRGIAKEGIVFNEGMTGWTWYKMVCEHCHEASCVWKENKEEMTAYNETIDSTTPSNQHRHTLYRQMAIRMNGGEPLGRGHRLKLPSCVVSAIRELCPSEDGLYVGHKDADDTED